MIVFTVRVNVVPASIAPGDAPATIGLVSAEAVELELRPARLPSRSLALLLDLLVLLVPFFAIFMVVAGIASSSDTDLGTAAATTAMVIVFVGYPVLSEVLGRGRSVGKRALGLRVIREDGGPLRPRHSFTRAMVGLAVEFPGLLLTFVCWPAGLITMIASAQGRRLGDLAAGTLVVHERDPAPWRVVPAMPRELAVWASGTDLTGIDDALAMDIRQFVTRVRELREPYRGRLLAELSAEVLAKVSPPPPAGLAPWLLLVSVLAERRRRQEAQLVVGRMITDRVLPGFGARNRRR